MTSETQKCQSSQKVVRDVDWVMFNPDQKGYRYVARERVVNVKPHQATLPGNDHAHK